MIWDGGMDPVGFTPFAVYTTRRAATKRMQVLKVRRPYEHQYTYVLRVPFEDA
jgi:hypothetical protein